MSAKKSIYTLFTLCISILGCGILSACFDIPSEPSSSNKATSVTVTVIQKNRTDSTLLKISTQDTATFVASVNPSKYEDQLTYIWYHDNDKLASGKTYSDQFFLDIDVPNRVVVKDKEGNTLESTFSLILNTPPKLSATIIPEDSTVFVLNTRQSIEFKWFYYDYDDVNDVTSYLFLDGKTFNLGNLNTITQSGFSEGEHIFKITVIDKHGDKAESKVHRFFVNTPEESNDNSEGADE